MGTQRVLVVRPATRDQDGAPTPEALNADAAIAADAASTFQEAVQKLTDAGYSAVVCWAERQDELAGLIRIRKAKPEVPILLLTPQFDATFNALALQLGATLVLQTDSDPPKTTALVRFAVLSGRLSEMHSQAARALKHAEDIRQLTQRTRELTKKSRALTKKSRELTKSGMNRLRTQPRLTFVPLVVEGDAEAAFRMVRALERADVFSPLPILRRRDEAIQCLDELSTPGARELRAMPSVLLLDSELPENGAIAVLKHVR